jgi:glutaredoxin
MFVIFGKTDCKWCDEATALLNSRSLKYIYKNVQDTNNLSELKRLYPEARTVPQVFNESDHIGGYESLRRYLEDYQMPEKTPAESLFDLLTEIEKSVAESKRNFDTLAALVKFYAGRRHEYLSVSELDRDKVKDMLAADVVTIVFTKKDGSERVMRATRKADLLPPQVDLEEAISNKPKKETPDHIYPVYDVEAEGWRSITWDKITQINGTKASL